MSPKAETQNSTVNPASAVSPNHGRNDGLSSMNRVQATLRNVAVKALSAGYQDAAGLKLGSQSLGCMLGSLMVSEPLEHGTLKTSRSRASCCCELFFQELSIPCCAAAVTLSIPGACAISVDATECNTVSSEVSDVRWFPYVEISFLGRVGFNFACRDLRTSSL